MGIFSLEIEAGSDLNIAYAYIETKFNRKYQSSYGTPSMWMPAIGLAYQNEVIVGEISDDTLGARGTKWTGALIDGDVNVNATTVTIDDGTNKGSLDPKIGDDFTVDRSSKWTGALIDGDVNVNATTVTIDDGTNIGSLDPKVGDGFYVDRSSKWTGAKIDGNHTGGESTIKIDDGTNKGSLDPKVGDGVIVGAYTP